MTLTITTNGHYRELWSLAELNDPKIREEFDYIGTADEYGQRLFKYRGSWYDLQEFEPIRQYSQLRDANLADKWDAIQTQSAFSALLVKYGPGYESVAVGYTHW